MSEDLETRATPKIEPETAEFVADPPESVADPATLELRAAPSRAVRFKRGLLIATAAGTMSALVAVAWMALEPAGLALAAQQSDLSPADDRGSPEALNTLPRSYGDAAGAAPVLGQPLPGDLGRPILEHQRTMASEEFATPPPAPARPDAAAQAVAAERQRRFAEMTQARSAPVLVQIAREGSRGAASADRPDVGAPAPRDASLADGINPNRLRAAASCWQINAGSTIAASLVTGLNSDLPGMVVAQVTEPVFDSATGRAVLIPQGARLLGKYSSNIAFGQRRAMLVWERLIMPDGGSLALDNAPATDAAGYSGLSDGVDFHTWQLLRGIGMSTLLGVGTELTFGDGEADLVRALRESIQTNADRGGQKIVERNLDLAPTITVRPGYPVRVLVHKDLVLTPWRG